MNSMSSRKTTEVNGAWCWMLPEDAQDTSKMLRENSEHLQEEMSTFEAPPTIDDSDTEELLWAPLSILSMNTDRFQPEAAGGQSVSK